MHRTARLLVAGFAAALVTASPATGATRHHFQLKNCNTERGTWQYQVFNADDSVGMVPYMNINFSEVGQVKDGECKGEGKGYCRVFNLGTAQWFHVQSAKTVSGDATTYRIENGLLSCGN